MVAGVVAFALFAVGASFAVRAFDRDDTPVAPRQELPTLEVQLTDAGPFDDTSVTRRVETTIDYGDVHVEGATSTTPDGAIVDWVGAGDLPLLVPGPTVGGGVKIETDGRDAGVLIGTVEQWPNMDRFQRIERLPDTSGEYVLVFQARYEGGIARQVNRVQLVEPGSVQLALNEGGSLDTASADAFVDGRRVEGFLSTSWFMVSDLGAQSTPRVPSFTGVTPVEFTPATPVLVVKEVDHVTAGVVDTYEATPRHLPVDLAATPVLPDASAADTMLVVDARWAHGQVGWAHDGSLEKARFFFPIHVGGDDAVPTPDATSTDLTAYGTYVFSDVSIRLPGSEEIPGGIDPDTAILVEYAVSWSSSMYPGAHPCRFSVFDGAGGEIGSWEGDVDTHPTSRAHMPIELTGDPRDASRAEITCDPARSDTPVAYTITDEHVVSPFQWRDDSDRGLLVGFDVAWPVQPPNYPGSNWCTAQVTRSDGREVARGVFSLGVGPGPIEVRVWPDDISDPSAIDDVDDLVADVACVPYTGQDGA